MVLLRAVVLIFCPAPLAERTRRVLRHWAKAPRSALAGRIEVPEAAGPGDDKVRSRFAQRCARSPSCSCCSRALLVDAPLEEPANPTRTPNPSKAPWYFLGLQEMLVFFDPWHAGVVLPSSSSSG